MSSRAFKQLLIFNSNLIEDIKMKLKKMTKSQEASLKRFEATLNKIHKVITVVAIGVFSCLSYLYITTS